MTTITAPPSHMGGTPMDSPSSPRGRRFLAGSASFLIAGLGQVIAGKWRRGLVWFVAQFLVVGMAFVAMTYPDLTPILYLLFPIDFLLTIGAIIDACVVARRSAAPMLGTPAARYALGVVLLMSAFLAPQFYRRALLPVLNRYALRTFVFASDAMLPTIHPHDRFLASRLVPFSRWSAIAFRSPEDGKTFYASRVAGLPGETIEVKKTSVFVNGRPIASPAGIHYVGDDPRDRQGMIGKPVTLGANEYFVLSDNSSLAADSRYWKAAPGHQPGVVPADYIYGPVTWIYWPMGHIKRLYRSVPLTAPVPSK